MINWFRASYMTKCRPPSYCHCERQNCRIIVLQSYYGQTRLDIILLCANYSNIDLLLNTQGGNLTNDFVNLQWVSKICVWSVKNQLSIQHYVKVRYSGHTAKPTTCWPIPCRSYLYYSNVRLYSVCCRSGDGYTAVHRCDRGCMP